MKNINKSKNIKAEFLINTQIKLFAFFTLFSIFSSCKKFVEIDAPKNSQIAKTAFKNNDLATSVILGLYQQMSISSSHASGSEVSIATICGVSSDEFVGYSDNLRAIFENQITSNNSLSNTTWATSYKIIYDTNAILEGLQSAEGVTPPVKAQLQGEALFVRAFHYFYLVNLFGDVPLHLSTDYKSNSNSTRASVQDVYNQIIKDLVVSEQLLVEDYVTTERVRPNKATVQALLARTYLYIGDWKNAEKYATYILEKNNIYKLRGLNEVFLNNSLEAIWQLMPPMGSNTAAGAFLILTTTPTFVSLKSDFVEQAFEPNDLRKTAWTKNIVSNGVIYYYPFKYKIRSSTDITEYYMVFRLAEQFLIRSEARAQQDNLNGSIDDLDKIRERAGLPLLKNTNPNIKKIDLLNFISRERRVELFSEWGDRWFDLKRNNNLTIVLAPIKLNWKSDYILFPIPNSEITRNKNISQNNGYY